MPFDNDIEMNDSLNGSLQATQISTSKEALQECINSQKWQEVAAILSHPNCDEKTLNFTTECKSLFIWALVSGAPESIVIQFFNHPSLDRSLAVKMYDYRSRSALRLALDLGYHNMIKCLLTDEAVALQLLTQARQTYIVGDHYYPIEQAIIQDKTEALTLIINSPYCTNKLLNVTFCQTKPCAKVFSDDNHQLLNIFLKVLDNENLTSSLQWLGRGLEIAVTNSQKLTIEKILQHPQCTVDVLYYGLRAAIPREDLALIQRILQHPSCSEKIYYTVEEQSISKNYRQLSPPLTLAATKENEAILSCLLDSKFFTATALKQKSAYLGDPIEAAIDKANITNVKRLLSHPDAELLLENSEQNTSNDNRVPPLLHLTTLPSEAITDVLSCALYSPGMSKKVLMQQCSKEHKKSSLKVGDSLMVWCARENTPDLLRSMLDHWHFDQEVYEQGIEKALSLALALKDKTCLTYLIASPYFKPEKISSVTVTDASTSVSNDLFTFINEVRSIATKYVKNLVESPQTISRLNCLALLSNLRQDGIAIILDKIYPEIENLMPDLSMNITIDMIASIRLNNLDELKHDLTQSLRIQRLTALKQAVNAAALSFQPRNLLSNAITDNRLTSPPEEFKVDVRTHLQTHASEFFDGDDDYAIYQLLNAVNTVTLDRAVLNLLSPQSSSNDSSLGHLLGHHSSLFDAELGCLSSLGKKRNYKGENPDFKKGCYSINSQGY